MRDSLKLTLAGASYVAISFVLVMIFKDYSQAMKIFSLILTIGWIVFAIFILRYFFRTFRSWFK